MLEMLWYNSIICVYRMGQTGALSVDYQQPVQDSSPGEAALLNFYTNSVLYLGEL